MSGSLIKRLAEARSKGDVGRLAEAIPYAKWMRIAPENTTGELLTRMRYHDTLIGNTHLPAIHGGTLGAMLEMAAIFHLLWETETNTVPKIVNITVDYLRSAGPRDRLWSSRLQREHRTCRSTKHVVRGGPKTEQAGASGVCAHDDQIDPIHLGGSEYLVTRISLGDKLLDAAGAAQSRRHRMVDALPRMRQYHQRIVRGSGCHGRHQLPGWQPLRHVEHAQLRPVACESFGEFQSRDRRGREVGRTQHIPKQARR